MPSRREFLAISLASSALPVIAVERREGERVPCGAVVVEMTSPLALAFRAEAVKLGSAAYGIHDDTTDLWYHDLDRQWRTAPATLAGITLSTSLFCLETLARDYGMRVWFRAIHKNRLDGRAEYVMSGDERLVEQAAAMYAGRDRGWAGAFARLATSVPPAKSGTIQQRIVEAAALASEEPVP